VVGFVCNFFVARIIISRDIALVLRADFKIFLGIRGLHENFPGNFPKVPEVMNMWSTLPKTDLNGLSSWL